MAAASPPPNPAAVAAALLDPVSTAAAPSPSHLVGSVSASCLATTVSAAATPPLSDPAIAVPPHLLGPAVGVVNPSPLPLLFTDDAPESST